MGFFSQKSAAPEKVTSGRFEIERDGKIAYLQYTLGAGVLALMHTEVPPELRGHGLASKLAYEALEWARANHVKVDVICPFVAEYLDSHPEYRDLVVK